MIGPVEVERSKDNIFWLLSDGTYTATRIDDTLAPSRGNGGYPILASLKKLKGVRW